MKITILTLFPNIFETVLNTSILGRAITKNLIEFEIVDLRQSGLGKHKVVDSRVYGGGAGMLLRADVLAQALKSVKTKSAKVILLSASGISYSQKKAREYSKLSHLVLICGHYEGVDQRFIDKYVMEEISTGDYVLTGGEIPALAIIDSVVRLIPKVLVKEDATVDESFTENLLEHPHFTRPNEFEGSLVPEVLKSGNHAEIKKWRDEKSLERTKKVRPDLLKKNVR
ncbi:MAG: tRNA (guanosine(37)-N1)-methyltransferase TrmD [Candidatus Daviesbacteria bacterium]|nr:tRNA (guanosine(37)-N1)-methyltransferase TrmD [Candidatus Daviesbacteria bacterium]